MKTRVSENLATEVVIGRYRLVRMMALAKGVSLEYLAGEYGCTVAFFCMWCSRKRTSARLQAWLENRLGLKEGELR